MSDMRQIPANDLDLQMILTDPKWGQNVPQELQTALEKIIGVVKNEEGKDVVVTQKLWDLLSFYTRDMRLGNLSVVTGEFQYCRDCIDLAGDLLGEGYISAFITSLSRAVTVLELSQSKGGFLRKRNNTITQEKKVEERDLRKKGLFDGGKIPKE